MTRTRFDRSTGGFTLVELLVVIAIIGILVALLMPAVQMAREAGRKATCSNNLRQMGIALTSYEGTFKKYPYGSLHYGSASPRAQEVGHSWWPRILPYIEQGNIAEKYDWIDPAGGAIPENQNNYELLRNVQIELMICPSTPLPKVGTLEPAGLPPGQVQKVTYAGIAGSIEGSNVVSSSQLIKSFSGMLTDCLVEGTGGFGGVTPSDSPGGFQVTRAHVKDGLSGTMLVAETSGWCTDGQSYYDCRAQGPEENAVFTKGACCSDTGIVDTNVTVRHKIGYQDSNGIGARGPNYPIQSAHSGGANVLMAGGNVVFLSEQTEMDVLYHLADRDDGQAVDVGGL